MKIPTLPGCAYAVTAALPCLVSAVKGDGTVSPLLTISTPGQYMIVAPTPALEVSDTTTIITPARGRCLPPATLLPRLEYTCGEIRQTFHHSDDNYNSYGFSMMATATGRLKTLTLRARTSGALEKAPLLLKLWTQENGTFQYRGVSENSVLQTSGTFGKWTFPALPVNAGDRLAFTFHREENRAATTWGGFTDGNMRVGRAEAIPGTGCFTSTQNPPATASWLPESGLELDGPVALHAGGRRLALASELSAHTGDASPHLTPQEHAALTPLLNNSTALLALLPQ